MQKASYARWLLNSSMKKLSTLTNNLLGQPMFKLLARAKELEAAGQTIYHFEIGDSDFAAHKHIVKATKYALDNDYTHYCDSRGLRSLRHTICDETEKTLGFRPDIDQVLVMPANAIIDFVVRCVANKGNEVIIPSPGFPTYRAVTSYTGVKAIEVPVLEEDNFHIQAQDIYDKMTDNTSLVILNSPSNPTGAVLTEDEVADIAVLASRHSIYLLGDEIYSKVIYSGKHYSPAIYDRCKERTIILNGFSKNYSMPGFRLGYAIGPKHLIDKMALLFETTYSCTPPFVQYAGIAALRGEQRHAEDRVKTYKVLRDLMVKKLREIKGIRCRVPEGATYCFPNITNTNMTSTQFADVMLEEAGVALLSGSCFGSWGEGYVRLCFAREYMTIVKGCRRMKEILG